MVKSPGDGDGLLKHDKVLSSFAVLKLERKDFMKKVAFDQNGKTELSRGKAAKPKGLHSGINSGVGYTEDEAREET